MNIPSTILAAGPLVSSLGAVFGPILCGLAFAVLSMGSFNGVYEDLNNPKPNPGHAISRGYSHLLMCSIVFATLMVVSPLLGAFAPAIPGLFAGTALVTVLSALANGGYEHLHETWGKLDSWIPKTLLWFGDKFLSFIPTRARSVLGNALSKIHPWLGEFYLTVQVCLFIGISIAISPALGLAGLGYFGVELARSQNKLPIFLGVILEKFRGVMEIISGFFTNNDILHLYSFYKLTSASLMSLSSGQWGTKNIAIDSPNTAAISAQARIIPEKFSALVKQASKSKLATELHKDGLGKDVDTIFTNYKKYYETYRNSVIEARKADYAEFEKLATSPSRFDRAKYYLGYVPMNLKTYLPIKGYYNPTLFDQFLQEFAATKPLSVSKNHMEHGQVAMPIPTAVDFSEFPKLAMSTMAANKERMEIVKPLLENLVNFKELKAQKAAEVNKANESNGVDLDEINQQIDDLNYDITCLERLNKFKNNSPEIFNKILVELCNTEKTVESLKNKDPKRPNRDLYQQIYKILYGTPDSKVIENVADAAAIVNNAVAVNGGVKVLQEQIDKLEQQRGTKFDDNFYLEFFKSRIQVFCDKVKLGNVAMDKSVTSVELWQSKSKHLINYITELLESNDEEKIALAFSTLTSLVEATDECAESIFTTVEKFYYNRVKPKFILEQLEQGKISAKDLVYINMTHVRNRVFNRLYGMLPTHKGIKAAFFFMDFSDKHDEKYIRDATQAVLHLNGDGSLISGDLSRKNLDVLKELGARSISWLGYRLLSACEQEGYSADGIIMELWEQFINYNVEPYSMQDSACPVAFNAYSCLRHWADSLQDANVKSQVHSILDAAIKMELDTLKLIKRLAESKDEVGKYISNKLNSGFSTNQVFIELYSTEEDDDKVQEYIMKMLRSVNTIDAESLSSMLYGLKHCSNPNVRNYVNKRVTCNDEGICEVNLDEFLAELKEFQVNKQIRELIRQKISVKNEMELQVKGLMALMLIDTGVFVVNSPEINKSVKEIVADPPVAETRSNAEPLIEAELMASIEQEMIKKPENLKSELRAFELSRKKSEDAFRNLPGLTPVSASPTVSPVTDEDDYLGNGRTYPNVMSNG